MRRWIVTFAGAGMSPVAPGTVGSLLACAILMAVYLRLEPTYVAWHLVLLIGLVISSALAVALGPWAIAHYGRKDPGPFVLDEVGGICLTLLLQPMYGRWKEGVAIGAAFVAFRIFDIWKPWPCPRLEMLPAGWGILMDDLAAAVYANILCHLILLLTSP